MSKGPGRQQRRILAVLEKYPAFYLSDLYRPGPFFVIEGRPYDPGSSRSEKVSLIRAANELWHSRKVDLRRARTKPVLVVARPGFYPFEDLITNPSVALNSMRKLILSTVSEVTGGEIRHLERNSSISVEFGGGSKSTLINSRSGVVQHLRNGGGPELD